MADRIQDDMVAHMVKATPRTDYNWEQYADGGWWALRRGKDYEVQTASARNSAKKWAESEGYTIKMGNLKDGDGFALQMTRS